MRASSRASAAKYSRNPPGTMITIGAQAAARGRTTRIAIQKSTDAAIQARTATPAAVTPTPPSRNAAGAGTVSTSALCTR